MSWKGLVAAERTQWEPESLGSQSKHHWPAPQSALVEQESPTWKNAAQTINQSINPPGKKKERNFRRVSSSWLTSAALLTLAAAARRRPSKKRRRRRSGGASAATRTGAAVKGERPMCLCWSAQPQPPSSCEFCWIERWREREKHSRSEKEENNAVQFRIDSSRSPSSTLD